MPPKKAFSWKYSLNSEVPKKIQNLHEHVPPYRQSDILFQRFNGWSTEKITSVAKQSVEGKKLQKLLRWIPWPSHNLTSSSFHTKNVKSLPKTTVSSCCSSFPCHSPLSFVDSYPKIIPLIKPGRTEWREKWMMAFNTGHVDCVICTKSLEYWRASRRREGQTKKNRLVWKW